MRPLCTSAVYAMQSRSSQDLRSAKCAAVQFVEGPFAAPVAWTQWSPGARLRKNIYYSRGCGSPTFDEI